MLIEKSGSPIWTLTSSAIISWPIEEAPKEFKDMCPLDEGVSKIITYCPQGFAGQYFQIMGLDMNEYVGFVYSNGDYILYT